MKKVNEFLTVALLFTVLGYVLSFKGIIILGAVVPLGIFWLLTYVAKIIEEDSHR